MNVFKSLLRSKKGAAMVEYAMLVAGVALVSAAAISVFGNKTADMVSVSAAVLPGANASDNAPIANAALIETDITADTDGDGTADAIALDIPSIIANQSTSRLGNSLGIGSDVEMLVRQN